MLGDLNDGVGVVILSNSPVGFEMASYALRCARAALHRSELPPIPVSRPSTLVSKAAEYSGTYSGPNDAKLVFEAVNDKLLLKRNGSSIALENRGPDRFFCNHPDFDLFLIQFGRSEGSVVEASYGPAWYVNQHYQGSRKFSYPSEWNAFPGHYRTATRHHVNFRIILRKGGPMVCLCDRAGDSASTAGRRKVSNR